MLSTQEAYYQMINLNLSKYHLTLNIHGKYPEIFSHFPYWTFAQLFKTKTNKIKY